MLFKQSIRTLLICFAFGTTASAQSPLWFEQSEPATATSTTAPKSSLPAQGSKQPNWLAEVPWGSKTPLPAPKSPAWIELNKVEVNSLMPENKAASERSSTLQVAKSTDAAKTSATSSLLQTKSQLTPWSALSEVGKSGPMKTQPQGSGKIESADGFIKRAELQLAKQRSVAEQTSAPKRAWVPVPKVESEQKISTQLTDQALLSGETGSEFRWPKASQVDSKDRSYLSVAANEVEVASEDSLIIPTGNMLAVWQEDDDQKKKEADDKSDEEMVDAKSNDSVKSAPKKAKFDTASMVGPLTDTSTLFSMLAVEENFQTYAASVPSSRTRDLDSQMQAAFTNETFTWISPVFYHKPLYFEQPNLERYGSGAHRWVQPVASSVHFFGTIPLLPYKVLTQHPCEKYYTLGNRRPGDCNPVQKGVILGQSYMGEVREYWRPGSGY